MVSVPILQKVKMRFIHHCYSYNQFSTQNKVMETIIKDKGINHFFCSIFKTLKLIRTKIFYVLRPLTNDTAPWPHVAMCFEHGHADGRLQDWVSIIKLFSFFYCLYLFLQHYDRWVSVLNNISFQIMFKTGINIYMKGEQ